MRINPSAQNLVDNSMCLRYNISKYLYTYILIGYPNMERSVEVFKALSNSIRLEILSLLAERQLCVNALVARLNVSQPAVSQHLRILEHAGLVKGRKIGYYVHYSLVPEGIDECSSFLKKLRGEVK